MSTVTETPKHDLKDGRIVAIIGPVVDVEFGVDDLPEKIRDYKTVRINIESNDPAELLPMEEVERRYILRVLEAVAGNKTAAARVLGIERKTLYRKLERYGSG